MKRVATKRFSVFIIALLFIVTLLLCSYLYYLRLEARFSVPVMLAIELVVYIIAIIVITKRLFIEHILQGIVAIIFFRFLFSIFVGLIYLGIRKNEITFLSAYLDALIRYSPTHIIQFIISPILAYPIITHFKPPEKKAEKGKPEEPSGSKTYIETKRPVIPKEEPKQSKTEPLNTGNIKEVKNKRIEQELPIIRMRIEDELLKIKEHKPIPEEPKSTETIEQQEKLVVPSEPMIKEPEKRVDETKVEETKEFIPEPPKTEPHTEEKVDFAAIETIRVSVRNIIKKNEGKQGASVLDKLVKRGIDVKIELPFAAIEPQLEKGAIYLPVYEIYELIPIEFINFVPAEQIGDLSKLEIEVPLEEVVPQIPTEYFIARLPKEEVSFAAKRDLDKMMGEESVPLFVAKSEQPEIKPEPQLQQPQEQAIEPAIPELEETSLEPEILKPEEDIPLLAFQEPELSLFEEQQIPVEPQLIINTFSDEEETRLSFGSFEFSQYEEKSEPEELVTFDEVEEKTLITEQPTTKKITEIPEIIPQSEPSSELVSFPHPLKEKIKPEIFSFADNKIYIIATPTGINKSRLANLLKSMSPLLLKLETERITGRYKTGTIEGRCFTREEINGAIFLAAPDSMKLEILRFNFKSCIDEIIEKFKTFQSEPAQEESWHLENPPLLSSTSTEVNFNGRSRLYKATIEETTINYFIPANISPQDPFDKAPYFAQQLYEIFYSASQELQEILILGPAKQMIFIFSPSETYIFYTQSNKKPGVILLTAKEIIKNRVKI